MLFVKIGNPQRQQGIDPSLTRRVTIGLTMNYDASRKKLSRFGLVFRTFHPVLGRLGLLSNQTYFVAAAEVVWH